MENDKMKKIALILARGGSKGIPNKNLYKINDIPMIGYCLFEAKNSNVDEVWVSTDSKDIEKYCLKMKVKVLKRPQELASDISPSEDSLIHFAENVDFDIMVFIQATSPLLEVKYINLGIKAVEDEGFDSAFSAYKEHWMAKWDLDGDPLDWNRYKRPRRQDSDDFWVENGAFYVTTKKALLDSNLRYSGNIKIIEMPKYLSFQVDTLDDIKLIEKLLE